MEVAYMFEVGAGREWDTYNTLPDALTKFFELMAQDKRPDINVNLALSQIDISVGIKFHVFADGKDAWTRKLSEAISLYYKFKAEDETSIRLYIEVFNLLMDDIVYLEDCIMAEGEYPS